MAGLIPAEAVHLGSPNLVYVYQGDEGQFYKENVSLFWSKRGVYSRVAFLFCC